MNTNTDPVRALIAKWRSESTSDDQSSDYECGEHSARSECADELEAALASAPPSAPAGVERLRRMVEKLAAHVRPTCSELWEEAQATLAKHPAAPVLAKHQPCGCVICTCEDEQQCQGCGAKHCGNRADHPPYVVQQPAAPLLDAVKVPQPRPDYPNGVLTIKAARDAFPRSHPMFAALDQAASDLAVLDARDRRRKQPAAPSGEAVEYGACSELCARWEVCTGHCAPLAAPQQPAGVDWGEVRRVAQHIGTAADYIDKAYPDANMLDRGPILRNMRRWHERLTAALAAQQTAAVDEAARVLAELHPFLAGLKLAAPSEEKRAFIQERIDAVRRASAALAAQQQGGA